jgi:hypothetical protein
LVLNVKSDGIESLNGIINDIYKKHIELLIEYEQNAKKISVLRKEINVLNQKIKNLKKIDILEIPKDIDLLKIDYEITVEELKKLNAKYKQIDWSINIMDPECEPAKPKPISKLQMNKFSFLDKILKPNN